MSKIYIDIQQVKASSEDVKRLSDEYDVLINDTFKKLKNINNDNIWVGSEGNSSAERYINKLINEEQQYHDFAKSIKNYADNINNLAIKIESIIHNL